VGRRACMTQEARAGGGVRRPDGRFRRSNHPLHGPRRRISRTCRRAKSPNRPVDKGGLRGKRNSPHSTDAAPSSTLVSRGLEKDLRRQIRHPARSPRPVPSAGDHSGKAFGSNRCRSGPTTGGRRKPLPVRTSPVQAGNGRQMQAGGTWIMLKRTYGVDHGADRPANDGQFVSSAHRSDPRVGPVSDREDQQ